MALVSSTANSTVTLWKFSRKKSKFTLLKYFKSWWQIILDRSQWNNRPLYTTILSVMVAINLQLLELDISVAFAQIMIYAQSVKLLESTVILCSKLEDKSKHLNLSEPHTLTEELMKASLIESLLRKRSSKPDLWKKTLETDSRSQRDKNLLKAGLSEILVKLTGL